MPQAGVAVWVRALRLPFATVSLLSVALGAVLAWAETGLFSPGRFLLSLCGALLLHLGANLINDWFDHANGSDRRNTEYAPGYSGGSRVLQEGLLSPRAVLGAAVACFLLGTACALPLFAAAGWPLAALGIFGILFAVAYSLFRNAFFVGETLVGISFGTLVMQGAFLVQAGRFSGEVTVFSIPVSLLVALILLVNEIPDAAADRASGKYTLAVRLGSRRTAWLACLGIVVVFASVAWLALSRRLPFAWLAFLAVPVAAVAVRRLLACHDRPQRLRFVHPAFVLVHAVVCLALLVALLEETAAPAALPLVVLSGVLLLLFVPPLWKARRAVEAG